MASISLKLYKTITFILIVAVLRILPLECAPDDLQCSNQYNSPDTLVRLRQHITCKYGRWLRPVKNANDTVTVKLRMNLKSIHFNDVTDIVTIHSFFHMYWKDYHVVWKPEDFDNVKVMRIYSWYLWRPDIGILSSVDSSAFSPFMYVTPCVVFYNGDVHCIPPLIQKSYCSANIRYWPYDTHKCAITMGSWSYFSETLNVTLSDVRSPLDVTFYHVNREWHLLKNYTEMKIYDAYDNQHYSTVSFVFVLERHSGSYAAVIIIPAVALMLVTLTTYWMDPNQFQRQFLAIVSIVSHFLFLQYLGKILPSNGDETPLIVTFYRDSFIVTIIALMVAIVIHGLRTSSLTVPMWASSFSSWIIKNRLGQIIIFHNLDPKAVAAATEIYGDEDADLVNCREGFSKSGWHTFTTFLDFLFFGITLLVYIILVLGFVP